MRSCAGADIFALRDRYICCGEHSAKRRYFITAWSEFPKWHPAPTGQIKNMVLAAHTILGSAFLRSGARDSNYLVNPTIPANAAMSAPCIEHSRCFQFTAAHKNQNTVQSSHINVSESSVAFGGAFENP